VLKVETVGNGGRAISVAPGSQRVPMLTLRLIASCHRSIPVHAITVHRRGLGDRKDILSVYAVLDGVRLTRGRQISRRSGEVQLNFRNFMVPSCGSKNIRIFVNFSENAEISGEHRIVLQSARDVDAGSAAVRVVQGRTPSVRSPVGPAYGAISIEYLNPLTPLRYGRRRGVARFRLMADNRDDHYVYAITLINEGSARNSNLQNLYLESGRSNRVTNIAEQMYGDRVMLVFNPPFLLKKSQIRLLTLRADIRSGARRTIQFQVEEPSDIEAQVIRGRR